MELAPGPLLLSCPFPITTAKGRSLDQPISMAMAKIDRDALQIYFWQSLIRFHCSISIPLLEHTSFCNCSTKTGRQHGLLSISLSSSFPLVFELCSSGQEFLGSTLQVDLFSQPKKLNRNDQFLQSIFFPFENSTIDS